jgi:predicted permease
VVEMALAVMLLVGAGLSIRSLIRVWSVDPGFNPHNVLTFGVSLPPSMMHAKAEAIRAAFREFDSRVASLPGVQAVSQTWGAVPFDGDDEQLFLLEGQPKPANENDMNWAIDYIVEPGYLQAMGISLQRGRFFNAGDNEGSPMVVVIDDVFAKKYFPQQDPIGKRIQINRFPQLAEIVGIVGHVKQWGLDNDDAHSLRSALYIPCGQMPDDFMAMTASGSAVLVRAHNAAGLSSAVRAISREMSSEQVIFGEQTMDSLISQSLARRQFSMILLLVFAGLALLLASVGVYGVISYVVAQRSAEIGLRIALGARPLDVFHLILGGGGKLAAIGISAGIAGALALTRLMSSVLYGISATDPATFLIVAVVFMLVALTACYVPARRASKVDPATALRYE